MVRLGVRLPSAAAVVLLAVGLVWAYVDRDADSTAAPVVVLLLGVVAGLAATVVWVVAERRPDGLVVPEGRVLPMPRWWAPVGSIGLVAVVAGALMSPPVLILGLGLVAVAVVGLVTELQQPTDILDRRTVRAARAVRAFAAAHAAGGDPTPEGTVEHIGRGLTRITVIGADGHYGDQVLTGYERARLAAAMAGMTVHDEWPRELVSRVRTGPYEWSRMAGIQLGGPREN